MLPSSVKDIRNFFSQQAKGSSPVVLKQKSSEIVNWNTRSIEKAHLHSSQEQLSENDHETIQNHSCAMRINTIWSSELSYGIGAKRKVLKQQSDQSLLTHAKSCQYLEEIKSTEETSEMQNAIMDELNNQKKQLQRSFEMERDLIKELEAIKMCQSQNSNEQEVMEKTKDKEGKENEQEQENDENVQPQVMDVKVIYKMFEKLSQEIKSCCIPEGVRRLEIVEELQKNQTTKVQKLMEDNANLKVRNETLAGAVIQLSLQVSELQVKVENLKITNMRDSIVLSGFISSKKKEGMYRRPIQFLRT